MYYLLENNRIIDNNNFEKEKMRYIKFPTKDKPYNRGSYLVHEDIEYIQIKNQSENVYDFIDKSLDLVKFDGQIMMAKHINGDIRKMCGISAIYKPDAKGNYIKVWEKKND